MDAVDPNFVKKAKIIVSSGLETVKYSSSASARTLEILSSSIGVIPVIGFITSLILLGWRSIDFYFEHKEEAKKAKETERAKLNAKSGAKALYFTGLTAAAVIGFAIPPLGIAMLLASTSLNILYDATKLTSRIKNWNASRKEYKNLLNQIPQEEHKSHPGLLSMRKKHKENTKRIWDSTFKLVLNVAMIATLAVAIILPPLIFPMLMTAFALVSTGFIYSTVKAIKKFFRIRNQKTQVAPAAIDEDASAEVDTKKEEKGIKQEIAADKGAQQTSHLKSEGEIFHALGITPTQETIAAEISLDDEPQSSSQEDKAPEHAPTPEQEQEESEGGAESVEPNNEQEKPEEPHL